MLARSGSKLLRVEAGEIRSWGHCEAVAQGQQLIELTTRQHIMIRTIARKKIKRVEQQSVTGNEGVGWCVGAGSVRSNVCRS